MRDRPEGCIEVGPQVSATRPPFEELIDRLTDHRRFRRSLGSCTSLQPARLIIIEVYLGPLHGVCQYTSLVRRLVVPKAGSERRWTGIEPAEGLSTFHRF